MCRSSISTDVILLTAALAGCGGPLIDARGFTTGGVTVKCVRDIPPSAKTEISRAAELAIETLASDTFEQRALVVLAGARNAGNNKPADVLKAVRAVTLFSLKTQNSCWPWSKTIAWEGTHDENCGRLVTLNRRKLGQRGPEEWSGTVIHELAHVANFRHDGNQRAGNECTVPYLLGDLAQWVAFERQNRYDRDVQLYMTTEAVCPSFANACTADPGCRIGPAGVVSAQAPQ